MRTYVGVGLLALVVAVLAVRGTASYASSDPDTTGTTCGPSAPNCTLGPIEYCVRVDAPSPSFDGVSDYSIEIWALKSSVAKQIGSFS